MARRWYVAQLKNTEEALINLRKQDFNIFHPRHEDGGALFPGYLFIQFDAKRQKRWPSINSTRGVSKLLGGEFPVAVPRGVIEQLMAGVDKRGVVPSTVVDEVFSLQDYVEVKTGPLAGNVGTVCGTAKDRVNILLHILGRNVNVNLHRTQLQKPRNG